MVLKIGALVLGGGCLAVSGYLAIYGLGNWWWFLIGTIVCLGIAATTKN